MFILSARKKQESILKVVKIFLIIWSLGGKKSLKCFTKILTTVTRIFYLERGRQSNFPYVFDKFRLKIVKFKQASQCCENVLY